MCPLGTYDTRPWEGRPKGNVSNKAWERETTAAPGGDLTFRAVHHPTEGQGSVFFQPGETSWAQSSATTLLIGAFDQVDGADFGDMNERPLGASQRTLMNRQVRMGPNITGLLQGTGVAEIDLLAWAGGARFVSVWAWTFWVNVAAIDQHTIVWEIRDRSAPGDPDDAGTRRRDGVPGPWNRPASVRGRAHVETVTWPVIAVADGPYNPTTAPSVFRWSNFPGFVYGVGYANGGSVSLELETRARVGAVAFDSYTQILGAGAQSTDLGQAGGGGGQQIIRPYSSFGWYATNQMAQGHLGGPLLISVTGSGTGSGV
jgi:hypothetical protein